MLFDKLYFVSRVVQFVIGVQFVADLKNKKY